MRFKMNGIAFWEEIVAYSVFTTLSIMMCIFYIQFITLWLFMLVFFFAMIMLALLSRKEYVTMDESGILCEKGNQTLWKYRWDEIAELRIGNRFRNPSIEIIPKNNCSVNAEGEKAYFQLGFAAKRAIKQYCTHPIKW